MKKKLLIATLIALPLTCSLVAAQEPDHSSGDKLAVAMTDKDKQMQMTKMQENMLLMHEQMHKVMNAKTPEERESLMQEHEKMMQAGMQMMRGMKGGHEMKGSDGKGGMKGM